MFRHRYILCVVQPVRIKEAASYAMPANYVDDLFLNSSYYQNPNDLIGSDFNSKRNYPQPPRFVTGMFANCFALNHVCQLCQRMAKYVISIDRLYQKYITRGYICQCGGAAQCWQTYLFGKGFADFFQHMSFGLPGSLQTPFELTD